MVSLVAPPLIDQVWWILLSQGDVYETFWITAFGGYVDRKEPNAAQKDPNANYSATLILLDKYKDIVQPISELWPNFDPKEYKYDYDNYAFVPLKVLKDVSVKGNRNGLFLDQCRTLKHASDFKKFTEGLR